MKKILLIVSIIYSLSCGEEIKKKENKEEIQKQENSENYLNSVNYLNDLSKIKNEGNTYSFMKLYNFHAGREKSEYDKFIPYSILMADKYNNGFACMTVYKLYLASNNNNSFEADDSIFIKMEKIDKEIVMKFLKKGKKLKNEGCIDILRRLEEKGIIKKNNI
jgi:hypothetical protein